MLSDLSPLTNGSRNPHRYSDPAVHGFFFFFGLTTWVIDELLILALRSV